MQKGHILNSKEPKCFMILIFKLVYIIYQIFLHHITHCKYCTILYFIVLNNKRNGVIVVYFFTHWQQADNTVRDIFSYFHCCAVFEVNLFSFSASKAKICYSVRSGLNDKKESDKFNCKTTWETKEKQA